ncbi:MAG: iron-sulfur cluster insertion protein ErpA [Marinospirillum sp.]|uniref:iron-sulfur cluster insertion protein ErpA n=1 Tax=Marinospirillum sp. TaxID=2183934 RepID=UPI0019DD87A6|nr:iron-sulfur cluster insertion protein ErpA [Marinospirillum sp.]MBE0505686.1 iron-sulfur cluster insertion protein ErpA [Marinospirillum sp.]
MTSAVTFVPKPLFVTPSAVNKLLQLVEEESNPDLCLRVYVTGGGCSGFQYGFDFSEELQEGDTLIEEQGARFVLDELSYPYLTGSTVDYVEGLEGARFIIKNPNASTTCGCGSSFSI